MALRSTVYKADLQIADMDRGYYADHALTIARHPSETEERMMVRLVAFALHASDTLGFGRGLSTQDDPDLWQRDLTGAIELWIDVGLPDEKLVRKACTRAARVVVLVYGGAKADVWWAQSAGALGRCANLEVFALAPAETAALGALAARLMKLHCTIQDGHLWIGSGDASVAIEPRLLKAAEPNPKELR